MMPPWPESVKQMPDQAFCSDPPGQADGWTLPHEVRSTTDSRVTKPHRQSRWKPQNS